VPDRRGTRDRTAHVVVAAAAAVVAVTAIIIAIAVAAVVAIATVTAARSSGARGLFWKAPSSCETLDALKRYD